MEFLPENNMMKYNPNTGEFTKNGRVIGHRGKTGHLYVHFEGRTQHAARVAFILMGESLPETVDHIDRDPTNNRWENLRAATYQQNQYNKKGCRNSTSRYKGVSFTKAKNLWRACIQIDGKTKHLGYFKCETGAALCYNKFAKELHKEFYTS